MADSLLAFVRRRAKNACEYCQLPQRHSPRTHEIDHIIAVKHRGPTLGANLALACYACSKHKSCNLSGIDPKTGKITTLLADPQWPFVRKWVIYARKPRNL
ncbi:MAG: HNH endonuclease [Planctomycetes bacterium]|nr:HNH endonuclease [Planctomycetota bacterium]